VSVRTSIASIFEAALFKLGVQAQIDISRPEFAQHGDFSTNIAMSLAKQLKKPPRAIAEDIINNLDHKLFSNVEIAGAGFINVFLKPEVLKDLVFEAVNDSNYGRWNIGGGKSVQVEFVSANPTGPITVANARGGPLGDSVARLLEWIGYNVWREFYVNDRGAKIGHLARSLEQRYRQAMDLIWELPPEGYPGEYLLDIARDVFTEYGDGILKKDENERLAFFGEQAVARIIAGQQKVLKRFGVKFDLWFSEKEMSAKGEIEKALDRLKEKGVLYEQDGAIWMKSTDYGDDKDFVVIKSGGEPTYTATDFAYHIGKYDRGFDLSIDLLGADHQGHTGPMFAALEAIGIPKERLEFLLYQLVYLIKGGQQVKMSKSSGEFVTLDELLDEVPPDAARYFYLMRSSDTHLNFDIDLAKSQTMENPVYYVQYAHVRCNAIINDERANGVDIGKSLYFEDNLEINLAKELIDFPDEVKACALARAPHRIASYAERVASAFHSFYHDCRVLQEPFEILNRRMLLVLATRKVLSSCLSILGVTAPERM